MPHSRLHYGACAPTAASISGMHYMQIKTRRDASDSIEYMHGMLPWGCLIHCGNTCKRKQAEHVAMRGTAHHLYTHQGVRGVLNHQEVLTQHAYQSAAIRTYQ